MDKQKRYETDRASNHITHLMELLSLNKVIIVVLYCRVSRRQQHKRGNLEGQKAYLMEMLQELQRLFGVKIKIVYVFKEIASGWSNDRLELERAALKAKECGAILVAESSCRFIRHWRYHSNKKPHVLPNVREYEGIKWDTWGVTLATLLPPDMGWKQIKSHQAKRGQRFKNNKGGRPPKKYPGYKTEIRNKYLNRVLELHDQGYNKADIVRKTGIPRSTIVGWIKEYEK